MEGSSGTGKGKLCRWSAGDTALDEQDDNDELEGTFFTGNGSSRPWSLFDVVVCLTDFPLESSNFTLIFAFQGGIIYQVSQLFLRLILHYVKLALDRNCGA